MYNRTYRHLFMTDFVKVFSFMAELIPYILANGGKIVDICERDYRLGRCGTALMATDLNEMAIQKRIGVRY